MPETHFTQWGPAVRVRNRGLVVGEEGSNGQARCEDLDIPSLFCFFSLCSFFLFRRVGVTPVFARSVVFCSVADNTNLTGI